MAEAPRAIIRKEDFVSFRRILGAQLPDTYQEWQYRTDNENLKIAASGHAVKGKEIDPQVHGAGRLYTPRPSHICGRPSRPLA